MESTTRNPVVTRSVSPSADSILYMLSIFCGFSSVGSISLSMFNVAPFPVLFSSLVIPSILFISIISLAREEFGKLVLKAWLSGIMAVLLYDISRVPFLIAGWDDFIPEIGVWLLQKEDVSPYIGYIYRYLGNGGGMGISFLFLTKVGTMRINIPALGTLFGLFVFCCLMLTLVVSPRGEELMFDITPLTFTGSLIGHIIYGLVLGLTLRRLKAL